MSGQQSQYIGAVTNIYDTKSHQEITAELMGCDQC